MAEDFESDSEESFVAELAKSITLSAAGAVAMVVGLYAGTVAVDKLKNWRENRNTKDTDPDTVIWEAN